MEQNLLESFDRLALARGYGNRSEAIRDMIRDALVQERLAKSPRNVQVMGSLTLVYDHHARTLADEMADVQHARHHLVVSVLHVHISEDDCMEVIVLRGKAGELRELADALLSLKGVKHGKLVLTMPGSDITQRKRKVEHNHPHTHSHAAKH
jgi:CopG family nickel-responsive transcriptional regulator